MKCKDLMTQPPIVVSEEATLMEAARLRLEKSIGCLPVVDERGKLSGILTESNFAAREKGFPFSTFRAPQVLGAWLGDEGVERIYEAARGRRVREIMVHRVVTVTEDAPLDEAVKLMLRHDVNRVVVVRDGAPVGVIARRDLLRVMAGEKQ